MQGKSKSKAKRRTNLVINLVLSLYCALTAVPLWYVFNNAFKQQQYIYSQPYYLSPKAFTFDNITEAFRLMNYPKLFRNSSIYLVATCVILIVFGSLAGFGIGTSRSKWMSRIYVGIVMGITIPFQLYMIPMVVVLRDLGLLGTYMGPVAAYAVSSLPFVVFIYVGFMKTIPYEMYEAATVDGCGPVRTLVHIYLPLLKPVTGTVLILRGVSTWNNELIPMITIFDAKKLTLIQGIYTFISGNLTRWDLIFGATLLLALPITILFLFMQKSFVKGLTTGSVKG